MISAFGVDHGEISKNWLKGGAESAKQAYYAGRTARAINATGKSGKRTGFVDDEDARGAFRQAKTIKDAAGFAGRVGYRAPEIAGGTVAAGAGGAGYYAGKKKKGSR